MLSTHYFNPQFYVMNDLTIQQIKVLTPLGVSVIPVTSNCIHYWVCIQVQVWLIWNQMVPHMTKINNERGDQRRTQQHTVSPLLDLPSCHTPSSLPGLHIPPFFSCSSERLSFTTADQARCNLWAHSPHHRSAHTNQP